MTDTIQYKPISGLNETSLAKLIGISGKDLVDKTYVDNAVSNVTVDTSNLATKEDLNTKADKDSIPTKISELTNDSNFATETFVTTKISEASLGGGTSVDLSNYATKTELDTKVDKVVGKGLSTEDFTTDYKDKLDGLENFNPTEIKNSITALSNKVNTAAGSGAVTLLYDINGTDYKTGDAVSVERVAYLESLYWANFRTKFIKSSYTTDDNIIICCQGDSITHGRDGSSTREYSDDATDDTTCIRDITTIASKTYPEKLLEILSKVRRGTSTISVIKRGYTGNMVNQGITNFGSKIDGCDLFLLMYGINDTNNSDIETYAKNYEQLIIQKVMQGAAVICIEATGGSDGYRTVLKNICKKYNVPYIPTKNMFNGYVSADIHSDTIHFNGDGYSILGTRIASALLCYIYSDNDYKLYANDEIRCQYNCGKVLSYSDTTNPDTVEQTSLYIYTPTDVTYANDNNGVLLAFETIEDNVVVYPNILLNGAISIILDEGCIAESPVHTRLVTETDLITNEKAISKSSLGLSVATNLGVDHCLNSATTTGIIIPRKGFHTLFIKSTTSTNKYYGTSSMGYVNYLALKK